MCICRADGYCWDQGPMVGAVSLNYYAILTHHSKICILHYYIPYYPVLYTLRLLWRFLHFVTDLLNPLLARRYHRSSAYTTSTSTASTSPAARVIRGAISWVKGHNYDDWCVYIMWRMKRVHMCSYIVIQRVYIK